MVIFSLSVAKADDNDTHPRISTESDRRKNGALRKLRIIEIPPKVAVKKLESASEARQKFPNTKTPVRTVAH
jgi:hypothetical protein